jgi:hypothetical protein
MTVWRVQVDRVRVIGAHAHGLGADELRRLVAGEVASALGAAPLPSGRAARSAVRVSGASLEGGAQIAKAVAGAVSQAAGGRAHG